MPVLGLLPVWCGEIAEGPGAGPAAGVGTPIADLVRPVPYRTLQSLLDSSASPGNASYWRSHQLPDLSDPAIDVIAGLVGSVTSPLSLLNGWVIGGAVSRVAPDATAVGPRAPGFELRLIANWRAGDAATGTWAGCARAGRLCVRTAPVANTPRSCPMRARPESGPRTAIGSPG